MSSWRISTSNLNDLYKQLQSVADEVKDKPQVLNPEIAEKDHFDPVLSQEDITLWSQKSKLGKWDGLLENDRKSLFFVAEDESGRKIKYSSANHLSKFFSGLVWLDKRDGKFDGVIASATKFVEVPQNVDSMAHRVAQQRNGVFSVHVGTRGQSKWGGPVGLLIKKDWRMGAINIISLPMPMSWMISFLKS